MAKDMFHVGTQVLIGKERFSGIFDGMTKVLIVTDKFMHESGTVSYVTDVLDHLKVEWKIFSEVRPDPDIMTVSKGVAMILEFQPQAVVALGGGSSIDAAKAIVYFAAKESNAPRCKFVAIPTTSGTGSEMTNFAVISNPEKAAKYPLVNDELYPDIAVLDAELVKTVPPAITAATGMDVFTHAVEAFVCTEANHFTDACAEKAMKLVRSYLLRCYKNPEDMEARQGMHDASCLAGIAFTNAGLGLVHGMAHTFGAHFHVPHGKANAILLPYVMGFNAGCYDSQLTDVAKKYARISRLLRIEGPGIRQSAFSLIRTMRQYNTRLAFRLPSKSLVSVKKSLSPYWMRCVRLQKQTTVPQPIRENVRRRISKRFSCRHMMEKSEQEGNYKWQKKPNRELFRNLFLVNRSLWHMLSPIRFPVFMRKWG